MKNLLNKNTQKSKGSSFVKFQNVALEKQAKNQVKGGDDIIIVEIVDM